MRGIGSGFDYMKQIQLGGHKKGSTIKGWALVDDEDFAELSKHKWYAHEKRSGLLYAEWHSHADPATYKRSTILMHRVVMKTPDGMEVDHRNGNGLDNQKQNLRTCTHEQNNRNARKRRDNTSGYKGVIPYKNSKWMAHINFNGKHTTLGYYPTPELAYDAYCKAAKELHGDFAHF